ncbi:MAG: hypothetical protein KDC98_17640 [Planctomycetes bacterium]|nr:hypothetical protein [Planctomycetota bacterium]
MNSSSCSVALAGAVSLLFAPTAMAQLVPGSYPLDQSYVGQTITFSDGIESLVDTAT